MSTTTTSQDPSSSGLVSRKPITQVESATVRFVGDSGDGMQLAGTQMTQTSAVGGNDIATFPDFPAEIRAPRGTLAGVSGFQLHFSSKEIYTPGDTLDALVAMNPAGLKMNLGDLEPNGILILDRDSFTKSNLQMAGYATSPLEDHSLESYQVFQVDITKLTRKAVEGLLESQKEADRCRNFFALGLVYWLYGRSLEPTLRYIETQFAKKPSVVNANRNALRAGWNYGETTDAFISSFKVDKAHLPPGKYRSVTGNQLLAWGLMAAARLSNKELFLGSYPITPASDILHELSKFKNYGVKTFQAEDEIAAIASAIGAAFGGSMGITTSSGPGIALKGEAIGLGVMLELPLIIVNVQRGGPSTGLPTKTEQADLFQAVLGRNGECPCVVVAPQSPADCFDIAIEAWRIATRYMVPVMILSDGYLANGSEPWLIPDFNKLPKIPVEHPGPKEPGEKFLPYERNEELSRPWAIPGTKGLMHRVGGLEKQDGTGNVSYDPQNHEHMIHTRAKKVANVANSIPPLKVNGPDQGDLLVLSWGGTYGACTSAVQECRTLGMSVAHVHLRHLNPLPNDLGDILRRYGKVLVPELNMGQLSMIVRSRYLVDAHGYNKVQGKPFTTEELVRKIKSMLQQPVAS